MFSKRNLKENRCGIEDKPLILLIDDEEHNLIVMRAALEDDFQIKEFCSGTEALSYVKSMDDPTKVTVIVCDQRMPGISGIEYFEHVKEIIPDTIRILFTAYTDMNAIIDSINKANIYKFITKPILPPDLLMTVKRAAELYKMQIKVKENERLKSDFIATISHELLTPMNGIYGGIELIKMDAENVNKTQNVNIVEQSAYHMMGLIRSVLDFTLLQSGMNDLQYSDVNLNAVLKDTLNKYRDKAELNDIDLSISLPSDEVNFHVDAEKIKLVVEHLLSNALKFTKRGSVNFNMQVKASEDPFKLSLVVEDTGIGIEDGVQESIFEIFKQADGSFSRKYGGLGIGLSLMKRIVELLNGEIKVESSLGQGSRFLVEFPVTPSKTRASDSAEANDGVGESDTLNLSLKKPIALVVEDNAVNQLVLKGILQKLGCEVHSANDGKQAVDWAEGNKADIIFMDCQMPVMDGFEAAETIRSGSGANRNTPIVAVTANVSDYDKNHCKDVGMNLFIPKPIRKLKIEEALGLFLGERIKSV